MPMHEDVCHPLNFKLYAFFFFFFNHFRCPCCTYNGILKKKQGLNNNLVLFDRYDALT